MRTALKNRIHAVLADEHCKAKRRALWNHSRQQWLAQLRRRHWEVVEDCLAGLEYR